MLAFENRVKGEAREAFQRMRESNIECKMITGDNIFVAIDTAVRCGLLKGKGKFILLEGKRQEQVGTGKRNFRAKLLEWSREIKETTISEEDLAAE